MSQNQKKPGAETPGKNRNTNLHVGETIMSSLPSNAGFTPETDALFTVTGVMRILMGDVPPGQDGDELLDRLLGRFEGREKLLFHAELSMVEYLLFIIDEQGGPVSGKAAIDSFLAARLSAL